MNSLANRIAVIGEVPARALRERRVEQDVQVHVVRKEVGVMDKRQDLGESPATAVNSLAAGVCVRQQVKTSTEGMRGRSARRSREVTVWRSSLPLP